MGLTIEQITDLRVTDPKAIQLKLKERTRRPIVQGDGNLFILAADHPARGALSVNGRENAMANRHDLLQRFAKVLGNPRVDGVLGTPDILEELTLMGLMEGKLAVGSMNRGGIRNSVFEYDDRFTSYTPKAISDSGIDFAKTLLRINLSDPATVRTLEEHARVIDQCNELSLPILLEPFMSERVDGQPTNILTTEAVELSVAIASGLGSSSAYSWLKLPVVENMERVVRASTLPILLLGGDGNSDLGELFESWSSALALPGVRGLVVGRSLLYPEDGDVVKAVEAASRLVHP
jgi:DhnA family fructose-bisphosphate aldolase class Ia